MKPAPPKKPKRGTALVPFKQIVGAFGAVGASGRTENGLADIEVDWAEGKEPELIGWLKKMGKLGGGSSGSSNKPQTTTSGAKAATAQTPLSSDCKATNSPYTQASPTSAFSSFPSTFVGNICSRHYRIAELRSFQPDFNVTPQAPTASTDVPGIDYESMTLLRMRQAERERIEREIREQEAQEG